MTDTAEMLNAALAKALGQTKHFVLDYGEPKTRSEAETLERAGAVTWRADRDFLRRTAGKVNPAHARTSPHPAGESVEVPPPALLASARLP